MIVASLGTCLATPEEEILRQGSMGDDMFYISKGDCAVNIRDEMRREFVATSLLTEGDHFGEVAMIYKCPRSATVVSRNYNTLARLSYLKYREIVNEYPNYLKLLKGYVF